MTAVLGLSGLVATAALAGIAGAEIARHLRAARAQEAAGLGDDEVTSLATRLVLIAAELRDTVRGLAACLVPPRPAGVGDAGTRVLVVTASLAAHGCARHLAARLRREGWTDVELVRVGARWPGFAAATARLASVVARCPARRVVVVAHGPAGLAARAVATEHRRVRTLVTLGTPHARRPLGDPPPGVEAIAIASPDDPRLVPPGVAHWPGACNLSIRGVGRLGMLSSPRVHVLVLESLSAPHVRSRPGSTAPEQDRHA